MRSRSSTLKQLNVTLKQSNVTFKIKVNKEQILENNPKLQESVYIKLIRKDRSSDGKQVETESNEEMRLIEENEKFQIYQTTIEVFSNKKYEYQYFRKINDKIIKENKFRGYEFNSDDPIEVDEWNKQWCKYNFIHPGQDLSIYKGYEAYIKELNSKKMIKLEQASFNTMSCKEIIDLDSNERNYQVCFSQIQLELDRQPRIRNSIYNLFNPDREKQMIDESLRIIHLTSVDNFSSNLISIDFREIDINIRKRMENYSGLFSEVKRLKQELQIFKNQEGNKQDLKQDSKQDFKQDLQEKQQDYENKLKELESKNEMDRIKQEQENYQQILEIKFNHQEEMQAFISDNQKKLEELKIQKEIEFDKFKKYSEETIKKYIDQYEQAYQKSLELEFKRVNFSTEEIIIQAEDINQLSKEDQNNLQELQNRLKIYESKVTEMKEENECIQKKQEKNNFKIKQKCKSSIDELKKCQELLEKCQKDSNIFRKENQIEKDIIQQKSNRYQDSLKVFLEKLKKKEKELITYQNALEELEKKYQQEKEQNNKLKLEFESDTQKMKKKYDQTLHQFQAQNEDMLNQQKEKLKKIENQANEQEKNSLSKIIDFEAKLKYQSIINKMPLENSISKNVISFIHPKKYPKQKPILVTYQQIIQKMSTHLIQLQEYQIKNLKVLGVQIISDIQSNYFNSTNAFENLLNENLQEQMCKLSVILNHIYQDESVRNQESKDIQDIIDLEQLNNQLQENLTILMRYQQDKTKYQDKKKQNNWFMYVLPVLIIIVFLIYQNVPI